MKASGPLLFCCAVSLVLARISQADAKLDTLSQCFLVKHVGTSLLGKSLELCTPTPDGGLKVIGVMEDVAFVQGALGFSKSSLEQLPRDGTQTGFAVSNDGRSIVFAATRPTGKGADHVAAGIHHYVCGVGDALLHPESQCHSFFGSIRSIARLPRDVMVFGLADSVLNPHDVTFALRADGFETPLVLLDAPALHAAAYDGRVASIDSLLRAGADPLAQDLLGMTAPDVALWMGHEAAAIRLIEAAPPDTATLGEFFSVAIQYGRWKTAGVLLERGTDPNRPIARRGGPRTPITPLMIALENSSNAQLGRIMFAGWSNERPSGDTREGIQFLLEHGADPNALGPGGRTALHAIASSAEPVATAVVAENLEAARILIDRGADAMLPTAKGNTPLHTLVGTHGDISYTSKDDGAQWGHDPYSQLLQLYVAHTKDLEVRNAAGLNPLQRAIGAMNFRAARYLVAHGASDEVEYNGHRVSEILAEELKSHRSSLLDKLNAASSNPNPSREDKFRREFRRRYGGPPQSTALQKLFHDSSNDE